MKIDSKIFKGIQYVEVNQLPAEQYSSIKKSVSQEEYIKIMVDGKILSGCLQYKDYEAWYHTVYRPEKLVPVEKTLKPSFAAKKATERSTEEVSAN